MRYKEVTGYIYIFFDIPIKVKLIYFRQPPYRFTVRNRVSQELPGSRDRNNYWNSRQDSGFCRSRSAARIATRIANTNLVRCGVDNICESKI
jgi:hypothetical protein